MPEDIQSMSPEELFSQQFKQQLSTADDANATGDDAATPTDSAQVPGTAPVSTTEVPAEETIATDAGETVEGDKAAPEGETAETAEGEESAEGTDGEAVEANAGEPEEPWDEELLKSEIVDTPEVEWKGVHEIKEESDEIDDGRKDGVAGVNGEMEDADLDEFKVITEKEFQKQMKELLMPTLMKFFRPEFLNRFDELIFFTPLRMKELTQIVDIMLRETREMLGEKNMQLKLSDTARQFLAENGYEPAFGARPLRRAIQEHLEDPLSDLLIQGTFVPGDIIFANAAAGKLEFKKDIGGGQAEDMFAELDKKEGAESKDAEGEKTVGEENLDENGVEDPFAELDEEAGAEAKLGEQADQAPKAGETVEASADSPFKNPDGTPPPQPGQEGYVFPADNGEANQQPVDANGNPIGEAPDATTEEQEKRSFLNKMFVKPKPAANAPEAGARESRGDGIRFENGKIVEE